MHFCCIWKWDGKYFYINDPASASSARAKGTEAEVKAARKKFFIFYKADPEKQTKSVTENTSKVENTVSTNSKGTEIIDVSKSQGTINWDKLSPKLAFVIIKASGLYKNGSDTQYANNVKGATSHGVPFHAYHFLYCTTESEARRDAKLFYDTVKAQGHMPLFWVLDCEKEWGISNSKAKPIAEIFEAELRKLAGNDIKVAIYIGHNVYTEYALDYDRYAYVWIPRYGSNNGTITSSIKPSYKCDLWQYTSMGKIDGISGNVDMDVITGDGKGLNWFLGIE